MLSIEIVTELSAKGGNFDGNSGPRFAWNQQGTAFRRKRKQVRLEKLGNKPHPHDRSSLEVGFRSTSLQLGAII